MWELAWVKGLAGAVGAMGSFISLRFYPDLQIKEKVVVVLGGAIMVEVGNVFVLEVFGIDIKHSLFMAFMIGIFWWALVSQMVKTIQAISWEDVKAWLPGRKG